MKIPVNVLNADFRKIPEGYVHILDAAEMLAPAATDVEVNVAAWLYLVLVVIEQHDHPSVPPMRYSGPLPNVYVNPGDVHRLRKDFEIFLSAFPRKISKRGRPRGSGLRDDEQVVEGLRMIAEGRATSFNDAAKKIAKGVPGHNYDATVRRLGRKMMALKKAALEKK